MAKKFNKTESTPVAVKTAPKTTPVAVKTTPKTTNKDDYAARTDLTKHAVPDLILWRDTASKRVDKSRARMESLAREYETLNKKAHSDIKWIRRLHNELSRKVFGHRPHDGIPFQRENPVENKINYHLDEIAKLSALQEAVE